jgi:hypothetical protein
MKYIRLKPIELFICIIFTGLFASSGYAETGNGHAFKLIKVTKKPIGSRINIQIKPEESYYHQKPSTSTSLPARTSVSTDMSKQAQKTAGLFNWFWTDFDHDISSASLKRLNDAERQLSKTPKGSQSLAPNLAAMRKLVSAYGT